MECVIKYTLSARSLIIGSVTRLTLKPTGAICIRKPVFKSLALGTDHINTIKYIDPISAVNDINATTVIYYLRALIYRYDTKGDGNSGNSGYSADFITTQCCICNQSAIVIILSIDNCNECCVGKSVDRGNVNNLE